MKPKTGKKAHTDRRTLPELDQTKKSVLNSLTSLQSRPSWSRCGSPFSAEREFRSWGCSGSLFSLRLDSPET